MKSPVTGKEMDLVREHRSMDFRKESFEIVFHYYRCADSGERFTSTALDELNIGQVYNRYRDKYNIPFPEEIAGIREQYGLSAFKMSAILGFGVNSYRQYEAGEMPSVSNARLIQLAADPDKLLDMIKLWDEPDGQVKDKCRQKAEALADARRRSSFDLTMLDYLLGAALPDEFSGYRRPDIGKFTEMVVYFAEKLKPFKTKLNKLLFYADFSMFRDSCFSISGVRYKAIEMGPVPVNFQSIFEYLVNQGVLEVHYTPFPQGYTGEKFVPVTGRVFNSQLFSGAELETLEKVMRTFQSSGTQEMVERSHQELAWKQNEGHRSLISYTLAFELNQM